MLSGRQRRLNNLRRDRARVRRNGRRWRRRGRGWWVFLRVESELCAIETASGLPRSRARIPFAPCSVKPMMRSVICFSMRLSSEALRWPRWHSVFVRSTQAKLLRSSDSILIDSNASVCSPYRFFSPELYVVPGNTNRAKNRDTTAVSCSRNINGYTRAPPSCSPLQRLFFRPAIFERAFTIRSLSH